jgi:3-oxoacyl-[acyl-carrier protein] reductase
MQDTNPRSSTHNRVALVTGGGRGIGLATAWELARQGAAIVIADLNIAAAEKAAADLQTAGHRAFPLQVDVARRESIKLVVDASLKEFNQIDVWSAVIPSAAAYRCPA